MIYGPINNAKKVFPAIAMADIFISEAAEDYFAVAPGEQHPRRLLM